MNREKPWTSESDSTAEEGAHADEAEGEYSDAMFGKEVPSGNPPLRERARARIGASERRWEHIVAAGIVVPYAVALLLYSIFDVPEWVFLTGTLAYSCVAMYASFKL